MKSIKAVFAIVILLAILAGAGYLKTKNMRDAAMFYQKRYVKFLNVPHPVKLPEFLKDFVFSAQQQQQLDDIWAKDIKTLAGQLKPEDVESLLGLIPESAVSVILEGAKQKKDSFKLDLQSEVALQNFRQSIAAPRNLAFLLALKAMVLTKTDKESACNYLEASLVFLPEAYRMGQGMFFDWQALVMSHEDIVRLCQAINYSAYHGEFSEYQISIILDRLKKLPDNFPALKDVLLQQKAFFKTFSTDFPRFAGEFEKERHAEFKSSLQAMTAFYESAFEKHLSRFVDIDVLGFDESEAMLKDYEQTQINVSGRFRQASSMMVVLTNLLSAAEFYAEFNFGLDMPDLRTLQHKKWQARQHLEGSRTLLALLAFKSRNGKMPASLKELNDFFNQAFGKDLYTGKELHFVDLPLRLSSAGHDKALGSADDILIFAEQSGD